MPEITEDEMKRLLHAAEAAEEFTKCERCGAWMFSDEPDASTVGDDFIGRVDGCWWSVTGRKADESGCFGARRGGHPLKVAPSVSGIQRLVGSEDFYDKTS